MEAHEVSQTLTTNKRVISEIQLNRQACGENLLGYGFTRMDTMWSFRSAYAEALKIKLAQDEFCEKAENGLWDALAGPLPQDLRWEALVDVLRGKVKVMPSKNLARKLLSRIGINSLLRSCRPRCNGPGECLVRRIKTKSLLTLHKLTNEFKFHIDSFHHAAEAYLVPSTLKKM